MDVVTVQMHLADRVTGDVDRDRVVVMRGERVRRHGLGAAHGDVERDVLAAGVLVGKDQDSGDDHEDRDDGDDDGYAVTIHDRFLNTEIGERARGDQFALTRIEEGGPRLARDDPTMRDMSSAQPAAALAATTSGAGKGTNVAVAPTASRMAPTADSTRALSQPTASAAAAAIGSWPSVPQSSRSAADPALTPAAVASTTSCMPNSASWMVKSRASRPI